MGFVRLVTEEVKLVTFPITLAAMLEAPATMEAAKSAPGRLGRLVEGRLPPEPLPLTEGFGMPLPLLLITGR